VVVEVDDVGGVVVVVVVTAVVVVVEDVDVVVSAVVDAAGPSELPPQAASRTTMAPATTRTWTVRFSMPPSSAPAIRRDRDQGPVWFA